MTTSNTTTLPKTQYAIQLTGPGRLQVNDAKPVPTPGPRQILLKVEAVGLCFSDLKLLKQFADHPRKAEIVKGLDRAALDQIASYVPGDRPVVPGHEVVGTIVAVGPGVEHHRLGERVLVQTDYRDLKTPGSNAAFGYNFEGGLQEYVLLDERVVIDLRGERYLIPAPAEFGASSIALVEPWACVENSYVTVERQTILAGGRLLVVADEGRLISDLSLAFSPDGPPAEIAAACADLAQLDAVKAFGIPVIESNDLPSLPDQEFDDIVYFGSHKAAIEILNDKLAPRGIINLVLGGRPIGHPVSVGVGRVHYGMTRWIGTLGDDAAESYSVIPETGELRAGDRVLVAGAGGPMGQMHVIRAAASGLADLAIVATDFDDPRLAALKDKVDALAAANRVQLEFINPKNAANNGHLKGPFTYAALMAPVGALVEAAIQTAPEIPNPKSPSSKLESRNKSEIRSPKSEMDRTSSLKPEVCSLINIFAGIPAPTRHDLDLDTYIARRCYMFGTSGSEIRDMRIVLGKLTAGRLDTDLSVDAVSGMAGAIDGLKAVENRTLAGKIIVYPQLPDLPLIPLTDLIVKYSTVAAKLDNGHWCKAAEAELLAVAG
jgi:threonine dehydrogenase-like Zn-dependent dehydrogenase